ncbi:putative sushi, von Willebrand factor [Apostichopus japonicus]|uniref:Putative sushi, von Willebrand factor n=1 Tax=Stichopus japonicus TaxID=307972 RepID=A0A2G8JD56_STIJA|nr:putative sushi, von Willebrand factor [Apostichopus japonicus]
MVAIQDILKALQRDGVEIFTFGIKNGNVQELLDMSSEPLIEHCYILSSFEEFESLARRALHEDLEEGAYVTEEPSSVVSLCIDGTNCCHEEALCRCGTHTGQYECICPAGHYGNGVGNDCKQIRCPSLLRPEHGRFFSNSCDNSVNSACAIACDQGYEPVGDIIRLCTESGEWTGTDFQCVAKMCDPFPNLENGFVNCTNNQFVSGTICTSRCEPGYSLVGTRDRKCLPIAQWDGLSASCIPVKCEALDPIAHARVLPRRCTEGMVPYKTECKTVCYKGYTRIGARKIRCGADRQWTIQDGVLRSKCIDITLPNVTCPADIEVDVLPHRNYATVSWDEPIASDSTGLLPNLKVFPSVSPPWNFPIGDNTVKYLATDRAGNSMSCSFTITVCAVEWATPIFSDNSGQPVNVSYSHRSGEMMPLGSTTVEYIASDAFGNVKRCIIQVTVQRRVCEAPRRPTFGSRECVRYLNVGLNCTLRCNTGYAFSVDTPTNYICYPNGSWSPHPVQHRECEVTYHTNRATQRIRLFYKLHNCSVDLVNDLEQSLATTLYDRIVGYCGDAMTCNVSTVSTLCNKNGALQNYLNSRLASEERPNERNRDIQGQRGVELTSDIFSALQGPVLEVLITRGANNGRIDLNPRGANNSQLLVLPEQTNPVCGEGSVLHETGECVPCSKGAYFDERTKHCTDCPIGMYQSLPGQMSCDLCPSGTSTRRRGSESNEDCQDLCTPGSFSSSGVEQCESCALGTYQPSFGARECIPCPNNTTTVSIGSTQSDECAAPCQPGTISSTGVEPCALPCWIIPTIKWGMLCHPCPNNGMTQFSGSESVESCNVNPSFSVRTSQFSELTDIYFSFCLSHTCVNGASCHDALGGFSCTCQPGYTGVYCEIDIDDCEPSPCLNGTCVDVGDFLCECDVGFQGLLCEENIDDCFPNPCHQNGVCLDAVADFLCECPVGFEGKQCERDVNECESSPCMNNGSCINRVDGFSCSCHSNFTGDICSIEVKECFMNSTTPGCSDFFRNSSCDNLQQDFAGSLCKGRYDFCISSPCLNNGTCLNGISGFTCLCQSGISGSVCDTELSSNFSLVWRHQSVIDYSILKGRETFDDLYEVTVAFWMRTRDKSSYGTPFSYATSKDNDNALTLTDYNGFVPNINNEAIVTDVTCNDGLWHHLALTWKAERGDWSLYKDGLREANGTGVSPGKPIPGRGVLVLGQEQDEPGGEFHPVESFIGEMALLYLWDRAMTDEQIYKIARSCDSPDSAVIRWPAFLSGRNGNVGKRGLHFCEGCGELEPLDLGNITNYQPGVPLNLVTFTCDVGFHVSGQETAECQVSGDWLQDENVQCRSKYYQCGGTDLKITSVKSTMRKDLVEREEGDGYNLLVG